MVSEQRLAGEIDCCDAYPSEHSRALASALIELIAARAMMKMAKKEGFGCRAEDNCGSPLCAAIRNYDEVVK